MEILSVLIVSLVAPAVMAVVMHVLSRRVQNANAESALGGALEKAGTTLEKLLDRQIEYDEWKDKAERRIEFLENEARRYRNWSARLFAHIKHVDPEEKLGKIPLLETDPKIAAWTKGEKNG